VLFFKCINIIIVLETLNVLNVILIDLISIYVIFYYTHNEMTCKMPINNFIKIDKKISYKSYLIFDMPN